MTANDPIVLEALAAAIEFWTAEGMVPYEATITVTDLPGTQLAYFNGDAIVLDVDAAGWGWDSGAISLVDVLTHEMGHTVGLTHDDTASYEVMASVLNPAPPVSAVTPASGSARDVLRQAPAVKSLPNLGAMSADLPVTGLKAPLSSLKLLVSSLTRTGEAAERPVAAPFIGSLLAMLGAGYLLGRRRPGLVVRTR